MQFKPDLPGDKNYLRQPYHFTFLSPYWDCWLSKGGAGKHVFNASNNQENLRLTGPMWLIRHFFLLVPKISKVHQFEKPWLEKVKADTFKISHMIIVTEKVVYPWLQVLVVQ